MLANESDRDPLVFATELFNGATVLFAVPDVVVRFNDDDDELLIWAAVSVVSVFVMVVVVLVVFTIFASIIIDFRADSGTLGLVSVLATLELPASPPLPMALPLPLAALIL